jgi:hypothetical protein
MKKNRFISMMACSVVLLSAVACSSVEKADQASLDEPVTIVASQDFPSYSSIDSLSQKADTIIEGTVENTRVEEINDMVKSDSKDERFNPGGDPSAISKIYTIYTVKINDTYKGNYNPGDTIEVKQLGGQIGDTSLVAEDKVDIASERDYIFFLATYVNTPASLLNPIQGLYAYEPVSEKSSENAKISDQAKITSAHQDNNLILELEDLNKIKSEYHSTDDND